MSRPILVMQMQRMGDLILSFPLFLWLRRRFPGHEIWVLAEKTFYDPLMPVSPEVTYFPWEGTQFLLRHDFELVLNLSIREQAAVLAGAVRAGEKLGPVRQKDGTFIRGDWQLYRASVVRNNRFNRYHWADLNALDVIPPSRMARTTYDPPKGMPDPKPQVGLFLGASEAAKHPSPEFWAGLCAALVERGIRPALFGGPAEKDLGGKVRRILGRPVADFCGGFGLGQLSKAMRTLALFVTPDTGPMHLAAWNGCPTLNLSMGNVNPWETGPYPPGHTVLRADMDCARGCWECSRNRLHCHDPFEGKAGIEAVAATIARMARGRMPSHPPPGLTMHSTGRDAHGLYHLKSSGETGGGLVHDALGSFWKAFFGWRFGILEESEARRAAVLLAPFPEANPAAPLAGIVKKVKAGLTGRGVPELLPNSPEPIKPFSGWAELVLENGNASPEAFNSVLDAATAVSDLLG